MLDKDALWHTFKLKSSVKTHLLLLMTQKNEHLFSLVSVPKLSGGRIIMLVSREIVRIVSCLFVASHSNVGSVLGLSSSLAAKVPHIVLKIALLRTDGHKVCGSISDCIRV